jgi:hypothetical protein
VVLGGHKSYSGQFLSVDMKSVIVACLVALGLLVAGVTSPAGASSATVTQTPVDDDDFGGSFGYSVGLIVGIGFLLLVGVLIAVAEAATPTPQSGTESEE